ncbi:MAG TPA: T9SS type A sorting domain-containing protein, partial [Puia sp.]
SGFGTYPAALPALKGGGGAATLAISCEPDIFGYYSYRHPTAITRKLFAIHPNGNTGTFTVVYDTSRNTNTTPLVQSDATSATSLMGRLVTVSYSGAPGAGVRVRFYYSPADSTNTSNALNSWITANPGATKQWQWVKYEGDAAAMAAAQAVNGFTGTYTSLTPDTSGVENGVSFVEFRNITSFSTFGAVAFANTTNSPLPITLHDFTAILQEHCAAVRLDWTTDMEQNSKDFNIQRSTDAASWSDIGTVAATGNSSVRKNYSYTDAAIGSQATYFYRLRLSDLDGTSKYSRIVSVRTDCDNSDGYLVYPNPVKDMITIQVPPSGRPKLVTIFNSIGQRMVTLTLKPGAIQTIPANGWNKGLYMVIITDNGHVMRSEKLIKQ